MTYNDIQQLLGSERNVYLEIKDDREFWFDETPDNGMRCRLVALEGVDEPDDVFIRALVDLSEFEQWNRAIASHNWHGKDGREEVTWFESGYYPENGQCALLFNGRLSDEAKVIQLYVPETQAKRYAELTWRHCSECSPDRRDDCMKCWGEWLSKIGSVNAAESTSEK